LKLIVSSILHLEKKLVKDVVWNFWNFVQLVKPQSCFKHVASFFQKPLVKRGFVSYFWNFGQLNATYLKHFALKEKLVRDFIRNVWT
jgi:hypothetical protein